MQKKRPWLPLVIASLAALAANSASAAGFGQSAQSAPLGQPLDFAVQLRLDAGEVLGPECVSAEVSAGDRRLPPALVRTELELTGPETARVRVLTSQSIDEPVLVIALQVGCVARVSRRFVVLADPPVTAAAPTMAAVPLIAAAPTLAGTAPTADTSAITTPVNTAARADLAGNGGSAPAARV
ncbi:MAG: hypothetical protein H7Z19_15290, partial [Chitinophagaceae bacterium]|nr:hypothetical protein [Rubrivivax sp.]